MNHILLKGGRLIDPKANRDGVFDILIKDDVIAAIDRDIQPPDSKTCLLYTSDAADE